MIQVTVNGAARRFEQPLVLVLPVLPVVSVLESVDLSVQAGSAAAARIEVKKAR